MAPVTTIHTLVLVEGESDAAAVRALVGLIGCDLASHHIQIRSAGGVTNFTRVLEAQGELSSFRRFQAMPQHRREPVDQQLRRFLGTRATRKIRSAQHLVEALGLAQLPHPLRQLGSRLLVAAARAPRRQDA